MDENYNYTSTMHLYQTNKQLSRGPYTGKVSKWDAAELKAILISTEAIWFYRSELYWRRRSKLSATASIPSIWYISLRSLNYVYETMYFLYSNLKFSISKFKDVSRRKENAGDSVFLSYGL